MTQDQLIILLFQIITVANLVAITAFVVQYTRLAQWWRDPIGRTIVIKDVLLGLILIPTLLSLFFSFNRLTSHVSAWIDIVLFGAIAPVMVWRIVVWEKIHKRRSIPNEQK